MKAIRLREHRGIDGIGVGEVDRPLVGPGEVRVDVRAAGVNPVDWKIAEGALKDLLHHVLPITLGCDVSGVVAAVGVGVDGWSAGTRSSPT